MFDRILILDKTLQHKSLFLFGPRQTGKSTYLRAHFPNSLYINLLNTEVQTSLMRNPRHLQEMIKAYKHTTAVSGAIIIIDEIQKIPALLDEVHDHMQTEKNDRFILTGSSARKIKISGVNLLGGRARMQHFFSIIHPERKSRSVAWQMALQWGGLPSVLLSDERRSELLDYIGIYLNEEIKAEALVRSLPSFSKFLELAAVTNTEQIVYESLASDVGVSAVTIKEYYQIMEDTLVGHRLYPFQKSKKRKAVASPKFYLFDTGVAHALLRRWEIKEKTPEYGQALEHFIYCELRAFIGYRQKEAELFYWRTHSKHEIDFIFQDQNGVISAIEVKASANIEGRHLKGIRALDEEKGLKIKNRIVICLEAMIRETNDEILIMPVEKFLEDLWSEKLL